MGWLRWHVTKTVHGYIHVVIVQYHHVSSSVIVELCTGKLTCVCIVMSVPLHVNEFFFKSISNQQVLHNFSLHYWYLKHFK